MEEATNTQEQMQENEPMQAQTTDTGAGNPELNQPVKRGTAIKQYFTATRIAYMGIFTALAYVLSLFDFTLLPGTPVTFLKLDFSNVPVMLGGFALGPVAGVIIAVLKELLHALTVGRTAFVGETANVIFVVSYMIVPSIVYRKHKGIKVVIITLIIGCILQSLVSLPVNYLLTFPAFSLAFGGTWEKGHQLFIATWYWALLFNFIKTVIVSVTTMIVYKPLSLLIKATSRKMESLRKK